MGVQHFIAIFVAKVLVATCSSDMHIKRVQTSGVRSRRSSFSRPLKVRARGCPWSQHKVAEKREGGKVRPSGPLSFSSFQFPGDDEGHLKREFARTERSRGGKCSKGSSHQFVEVRFLLQSKRTGVPSGTDETPRRQLPESKDQQVQLQVRARFVHHEGEDQQSTSHS